MNIILEGMDATGKTTLANKLSEHYALDIIHSGTNDYVYFDKLLDNNAILDRSYISEVVFSKLYNRKHKLTNDEFETLLQKSRDNKDIIVILISSDLSLIYNRLIARQEYECLPETRLQLYYFNDMITNLQYERLIVADVSKDNIDLAKQIKEMADEIFKN